MSLFFSLSLSPPLSHTHKTTEFKTHITSKKAVCVCVVLDICPGEKAAWFGGDDHSALHCSISPNFPQHLLQLSQHVLRQSVHLQHTHTILYQHHILKHPAVFESFLFNPLYTLRPSPKCLPVPFTCPLQSDRYRRDHTHFTH